MGRREYEVFGPNRRDFVALPFGGLVFPSEWTVEKLKSVDVVRKGFARPLFEFQLVSYLNIRISSVTHSRTHSLLTTYGPIPNACSLRLENDRNLLGNTNGSWSGKVRAKHLSIRDHTRDPHFTRLQACPWIRIHTRACWDWVSGTSRLFS